MFRSKPVDNPNISIDNSPSKDSIRTVETNDEDDEGVATIASSLRSDDLFDSLNDFDSPIIYKYPTGTIGADSKQLWYAHRLSPETEAILKQLQNWIQSKRINISTSLAKYSIHPSLVLLRYLRANNFHFDKTTAHILRNIEWRKEHNIEELMQQSPNEILGVNLRDLCKYMPSHQCGCDSFGRPVLYKTYENFKADLIKKLVPFEKVVRYHIWEQEVCSRLCYEESIRRERIIETMTIVVDVKNMTMSQVTKDFLGLVKLCGSIDSAQYPETLGRIFIINSPSVFPIVWRLIKVWLDPVVASKIEIISNESSWKPKLLDFIGEANLPSNYGGKASAIIPGSHPYAQYMANVRSNDEHDLAYWNSNRW